MRKQRSEKDLRDAIEAVRQLADDAILGRLVDTATWDDCPGGVDAERVSSVAEQLDPDFAGENDFLREIPDDDLEGRACTRLCATRDVFFKLGLFMGARLADPSGRAFDCLAAAWIRSKSGSLPPEIKVNSDDATAH